MNWRPLAVERAVIYDNGMEFYHEDCNEFFDNPDYHYDGFTRVNGIVIHAFTFLPKVE